MLNMYICMCIFITKMCMYMCIYVCIYTWINITKRDKLMLYTHIYVYILPKDKKVMCSNRGNLQIFTKKSSFSDEKKSSLSSLSASYIFASYTCSSKSLWSQGIYTLQIHVSRVHLPKYEM